MKFLGAILAAAVITLTQGPTLAAEIDPKLEAAIRSKAAETLLDPYSAVFTFDIVRPINDIGGKICGTVNAKNAYGAFAGRKFFWTAFMRTGDGYVIPTFGTINATLDFVLGTSHICD